MNFLEAIAELQKPENIETKCIRPVAWGDCYDHHIIVSVGDELRLCYESENYDPYDEDSNPFFISSRIDTLTGEWAMCDIPVLPENEYEDEQ